MNNEIRQKIAFEMNYSETAFIQLLEENDSFSESMFNPTVSLRLQFCKCARQYVALNLLRFFCNRC